MSSTFKGLWQVLFPGSFRGNWSTDSVNNGYFILSTNMRLTKMWSLLEKKQGSNFLPKKWPQICWQNKISVVSVKIKILFCWDTLTLFHLPHPVIFYLRECSPILLENRAQWQMLSTPFNQLTWNDPLAKPFQLPIHCQHGLIMSIPMDY